REPHAGGDRGRPGAVMDGWSPRRLDGLSFVVGAQSRGRRSRGLHASVSVRARRSVGRSPRAEECGARRRPDRAPRGRAAARREEDSALAWRYRRLGLLPEGTLGREYWKYSRKNGFAMPGEIAGPDEIVVNHDLIHVLTGYDTDPPGEFEAAGFTAGICGEDP